MKGSSSFLGLLLWICSNQVSRLSSRLLVKAFLFIPPSFGPRLRKDALRFMMEPNDGMTASMMLDPLLVESFDSLTWFHFNNTSLRDVSRGLSVWRRTLFQGRVPVENDFRMTTDISAETPWPAPSVLFDALVNHLVQLQIPRLVQRHPELISPVLRSLLRLVDQFAQKVQSASPPFVAPEEDELVLRDPLQEPTAITNIELPPPWTVEGLEQIAADVVAEEFQELLPGISGMQALDQLFGAAATDAFIMEHHIGYQNNSFWHHTGWTVIPALQNEIRRLPALRRLIQSLGRRSTSKSDGRTHKFLHRPVDPSHAIAMQHAHMDPRLARDMVSGLTRSNRYSEMLPSEAMGLLQQGSRAPVLRRMFYAKLVESQLLCYEVSGWSDVSSRSPKTTRYHRTPSARGGPILICLDTSQSMTSAGKEWISKAVVLATVRAAHLQQRTCRLIAFGSKGTVMEAGDALLRPDAAGIRHLLDFLSHSFGGGTDVTGALKYALTLIVEEPLPEIEMSAADWLLITDGEIPPVSEEILQQLRRLQETNGLQVHGVLVGHTTAEEEKSIQALEEICTHTHDFLLDFPGKSPQYSATQRSNPLVSSALYAHNFNRAKRTRCRRRFPSLLFARNWKDDDDYDDDLEYLSNNRRIRSNSVLTDDIVPIKEKRAIAKVDDSRKTDDYVVRVQNALECIHAAALAKFKKHDWNVSSLLEERNSAGSCWRYREQFQEAVNRVGENLIEREVESRLVVLGMISGEHVLFLGPPGTAKSALGRRLSKICGGALFQRLLTRFTTPEEIFGPLSLRALENDEYKRCTDGFLPTASVAFLDEIFKANSAILNTLLTILNERQFDNGAGRREDCPIRCVIAASNELPESEELEALYDRFLLRKEVLPVSDEGIVELLTSVSTPGISSCDNNWGIDGTCDTVFANSLDEIVKDLSLTADAVQMDSHISYLLRDLRAFLRDEMNVNISDRRLLKAARLLKIVAASEGRLRVDPIDCLLLQHVAWSQPEHRETIREWLWDHVTPDWMNQGQYNLLLNGLRQTALTVIRRTNGDVIGDSGARDEDVTAIGSIRIELSHLITLLKMQANALSRHMELLRQSLDHLWLGAEEAQSSQQILIPPAQKSFQETQRLLIHALQLEIALSSADVVPSIANRGLLPNNIRLSVVEQLWDETDESDVVPFSDLELNISMKEAKVKWDSEIFRKWKRERKKRGIK